MAKGQSQVALAHRDTRIAEMYLQGMSQYEIGQAIGIDRSQVSRVLSNEHAREIVQSSVRAMAAHAREVGLRLIELTRDKDKAVRQKAISEYNKVIGIAGAHASTVIQNIYIDQRVQLLQPQILSALECSQVIDAEVIEADD